MKRVAFIGHRDMYYGAESVMLRIARLVKSKQLAEPIMVLPKSKHNGFREQMEHDNFKQVKFYPYKLIGHSAIRCFLCLLYNFLGSIKAYFELKKLETDVVYTNTSVNIFGAMVAYWLQKPHIWHFHEQPSGGAFKWIPKPLFPIYRYLISRKNTTIVFISNTQKLLWEKEFCQNIPNAMVIYTPPAKLSITPNSLAKNDKPVFGFLGSFTESKNILSLLTATAKLNSHYPDVFEKLILMGAGEFEEQINKKTKELDLQNVVELWPHHENIAPFYAAIDIFILPSFFESWGLVALEAISEKKPLILTQNTGLKEILNHNEDCIFIDPFKTEEIFHAMEKLLLDADFREALAKNAYRKIESLNFAERFENAVTTLFS
ncbi:glycosyltransferase family 4 protein [Pedobacter mucosus]|uniref:glycosyltransferase family 4 protein n=1 Tax=Pedobacter mucosus TaxID=2895286 RepID=UPI001EE3AC23|nr:glycosyltransferase family 4 protein [Pedobacter mucosus]UKT63275.1 glycosyltransferase family 4 protein [Pedobacter mucosus]